jgi:dCTP diphosphatase
VTDTQPVTDLSDLTARMREFSEARDWGRFHDLKSLTLALVGEVGEVAELVQWLPAQQAGGTVPGSVLRERLGDELADVLLYLVRLADVAGVDLARAATVKLQANERRFPPEDYRAVAPTKS